MMKNQTNSNISDKDNKEDEISFNSSTNYNSDSESDLSNENEELKISEIGSTPKNTDINNNFQYEIKTDNHLSPLQNSNSKTKIIKKESTENNDYWSEYAKYAEAKYSAYIKGEKISNFNVGKAINNAVRVIKEEKNNEIKTKTIGKDDLLKKEYIDKMIDYYSSKKSLYALFGLENHNNKQEEQLDAEVALTLQSLYDKALG